MRIVELRCIVPFLLRCSLVLCVLWGVAALCWADDYNAAAGTATPKTSANYAVATMLAHNSGKEVLEDIERMMLAMMIAGDLPDDSDEWSDADADGLDDKAVRRRTRRNNDRQRRRRNSNSNSNSNRRGRTNDLRRTRNRYRPRKEEEDESSECD